MRLLGTPSSLESGEIRSLAASLNSKINLEAARVEAARVEAARVEAARVEAEKEAEKEAEAADALASLLTEIENNERKKHEALDEVIRLSEELTRLSERARETEARAKRLVDIFASFYIR